jgi:hypothetical protein
MFRRQQQEPVVQETVVSLTPELQEALQKLEGDTDALTQMVFELVYLQKDILQALQTQLNGGATPAEKPKSKHTVVADEDRIRAPAYDKRPRREQVDWLRNVVLADGKWYTGLWIAEQYGKSKEHCRYLKSAVNGRLREMYRDGELERRDSNHRGALYEYRLKAAR